MNPSETTRWSSVYIVLAVGIIAASQIGKAPPSLPLIRAELKLSLLNAGWVLSAVTVPGAVIGILIGAFADLVGHRWVVILALSILALASLMGAQASTAETLLASRVCEGVGYACILVCGTPLIARVSSIKDRPIAIAIWSSSVPSGMTLMILISPIFLVFFSWRELWMANAFAGGVLLWIFYRLIRLPDQEKLAISRRDGPGLVSEIKHILKKPGPPILSLLFCLYSLQYMAIMGFLPILLIDKLIVSHAIAAILTALMVCLNIFGNLLGGRLLSIGLTRSTLILAANTFMVMTAVFIYADIAPPIFRYFSALSFSFISGLVPVSLIAGIDYHAPAPSLVGTTAGVVMQGGLIGSSIGPPALAYAVETAGGWQGALWVLMAAGITSFIAAGYLGYLGHKAQSLRRKEET